MSSPAWWLLVRSRFSADMRDSAPLVLQAISLMIRVTAFALLWRALVQHMAGSYTASQIVWYVAIAQILGVPLIRLVQLMDEDLRGGGLDYCLLERYPYLLNRLLYHLGSRVAQIVPMVLGASTVALLVGGWPPIRVPGYLALCVAGFMSLLAAYALVALVACMAPLLGDVRPLQVVMSRITLLFGGVLFPLGIAPSWLAGVARYLPFRLIAYNVVNLAFNPGLHASIVVIASQSTMIITTLGLAEIMYLIGMRRT